MVIGVRGARVTQLSGFMTSLGVVSALLLSPGALAQDVDGASQKAPIAEPPPAEPATPANPTEPAPPASQTSTAQPAPEAEKSAQKPDPNQAEQVSSDPQITPPPAPPKAGDQEPAPYLKEPDAPAPLRGVELGMEFSIVGRPANGQPASGGTVEYQPGPMIGGYAFMPLASWRRTPELGRFLLGIRLRVGAENHAVDLNSDLGVPGAELSQDNLNGLYLGAQLEPGFNLTDWLSVYAATGVTWGRLEAPPLESASATVPVAAAMRAGTYVEIPLLLGVNVEVLPNWINVGLSGGARVLTSTTGTLFHPSQAIAGRTVTLDAFPPFDSSFSGTLTVGIIL